MGRHDKETFRCRRRRRRRRLLGQVDKCNLEVGWSRNLTSRRRSGTSLARAFLRDILGT